MKANEAPEKLYLNWTEYPLNEIQVEYTRTDAFIEKACDAYCKTCRMPNCKGKDCKFIENFKSNMKEE